MKKYIIKETIIWVILLLILCFSTITAYNSFDNSREYYIVEKINQVQLQLNNIEEHQRYIEIKLEENLFDLE